jgi:uncharacterized membrane protein YkvA (DUF1232 family)
VNPYQGNILTRMLEMVRRTWVVFMSRKTPWYVKLLLGAGLVYILSPYDLIPEWVPVFGILDDLALAALLIAWASSYRSG